MLMKQSNMLTKKSNLTIDGKNYYIQQSTGINATMEEIVEANKKTFYDCNVFMSSPFIQHKSYSIVLTIDEN